jgi:hypothetical protein
MVYNPFNDSDYSPAVPTTLDDTCGHSSGAIGSPINKRFAVIVFGLVLAICISTFVSAAQSANEPTPDLVVVAEAGILKPLARLLIPKEITTNNVVIGTLTDAIYCRPLQGNTALILGQLTKSNRKKYAPNLVAQDCNADMKTVASRHDHDLGFSAVISFEVDWATWKVKRVVRDFSPAPSEIFHEGESQAIKAYKSEIPTSNVTLDSDKIHETYNVALHYLPKSIAIGFFKKLTTTGNVPWWKVGNMPQHAPDPQINELLYVRHSLISALIKKYPDQAHYTLPTGHSLQANSYSFQPWGDKPAVFLGASVPFNDFNVELETRWLGSPLTYAGSSAKPKPDSGAIAEIAAQLLTKACDDSLANQAILPKNENAFHLNFGSIESSLHFIAKFSSANKDYLFFAGNGGIDLAH